MIRRRFFKTLGLALVGTTTAGCAGGAPYQAFTPSPEPTLVSAPTAGPKRVLVIGAGLAGLAAAAELRRQGRDVVVIEARERVGGRLWTSRKWPDMPLDLGASWIHGTQGNPLTQLADTANARRIVTRYERSIAYNTNGKPLTEAEDNRLDAIRKQLEAALASAQKQEADASIRQAVTPLLRTLAEGSEAQRFASFILNSEYEQEYAGSVAQLSAHWHDDAQAFKGDDVLFADGYNVITDHLAAGLRIELGQQVAGVQWGHTPVRVDTQKSQFTADQVIITLPLGVLQAGRVRFVPELPRAKQQAIAALGMGVLNKLYLRFPAAFWPADVDWIEHVPASHGVWTEWVSLQRAAKLPVLLGFNAADRGREIEALPDRAVVADAMGVLRTIFGARIPDPVDFQITRWASDPFALGSYSFTPVGATRETRRTLAAPLGGQLFFAGEAASPELFGTAHGAYLSGMRAARDVLAA